MKIGYGRVSTRDQNPDAQRDALTAAECEQVVIDKASGKLARRPELDRALLVARTGDQLVVSKLDPLGRSLKHLIDLAKDLQACSVDLVGLYQGIDTSTAVGRMFFQILGAIAEFEHALMSERTMDGLAAARVRGRRLGPRSVRSLPATAGMGCRQEQRRVDPCPQTKALRRRLPGTATRRPSNSTVTA
jgi:DNA invertase Pin-like site-specific DNA recombinase